MSIELKKQIKNNLLAILSIAIAISALGYNSWRNELSEENRNYRAAGFEIMREAAHLQYLADTLTYSQDKNKADPIEGWVRINLIISLSKLMMPEIQIHADRLKRVWEENWTVLKSEEVANKKLSDANNQLVEKVREHLLLLQ